MTTQTPTPTMVDIPSLKIVILGDGGVGKTALIQRLMTGQYNSVYEPTLGVNVTPIVFETTKGLIRFNVWDCAGQERFQGLGEGYCVGADGAIVMCDLGRIISWRNMPAWIKWIPPNTPFIRCGNKCDLPVTVIDETLDCVISCRTESFTEPFLALARILMKCPDLEWARPSVPCTHAPPVCRVIDIKP